MRTVLMLRSDVLSHVQDSMSLGHDPSQTLSRLMDWAEARQVGSWSGHGRTTSNSKRGLMIDCYPGASG